MASPVLTVSETPLLDDVRQLLRTVQHGSFPVVRHGASEPVLVGSVLAEVSEK
jgi:CBS domain-containing protein